MVASWVCCQLSGIERAGHGGQLGLLPAVWNRDGRPCWPAESVAICLE